MPRMMTVPRLPSVINSGPSEMRGNARPTSQPKPVSRGAANIQRFFNATTRSTAITAPTFFGTYNALLPVWLGRTEGRDLATYVTTNGGISWVKSAGFAKGAEFVDYVSTKDGFTWDHSGVFQVTHNAGGSWTPVTPNINIGDDFRGMDFVSTTTGWVIQGHTGGYTSLYKTINGGINWNLINLINQNYTDVRFVDSKIGYLVGFEGKIYKTTNGGNTVGIQTISSEIPKNYSLYQNYPNPFNPVTVIQYTVGGIEGRGSRDEGRPARQRSGGGARGECEAGGL